MVQYSGILQSIEDFVCIGEFAYIEDFCAVCLTGGARVYSILKFCATEAGDTFCGS